MKNFSFSVSQVLLKVINEDARTVAAGDLAGDHNLDFEQPRAHLKCRDSCKTSFCHGELCQRSCVSRKCDWFSMHVFAELWRVCGRVSWFWGEVTLKALSETPPYTSSHFTQVLNFL